MSASEQHNSSQENNRDGGACPAFDELSAYFDGALEAAEASAVEKHVSECAECQTILDDLSILRTVLQATNPAARSRTFRLSEAEAGMQSRPIDRDFRKARPFPLYPVFAGIAALLVVALLTGDLLFNDNGSSAPEPNSANQILVIDGTPYGPDGAIYNSASADDMNDQDPGNDAVDSVSARESDSRFLNGWRVAQLLAVAGLIFALGLWYLNRETARAAIRR